MKNQAFVAFSILVSVASPAALKAAVNEEYTQTVVANTSTAIEQVLEKEESAAPSGEVPADSKELVLVDDASAEQIENGEATAVDTAALQAPAVVKTAAISAPVTGGNQALVMVGRSSSRKGMDLRLTPMAGAALHLGPWTFNVRNQYTFGMALELPVSRFFSAELEGGYANYRIAYSQSIENRPDDGSKRDDFGVRYSFNQYSAGLNGKVYLLNTRVRPFIGAGMSAVLFDISRGIGSAREEWRPVVGYGSLMAGVDVRITDSVSFGARAQWYTPLINRPLTVTDSETTSYRGYEEAAMINSNFVRMLGAISITL